MTPQTDNKIFSSFLLYLDHQIQHTGQAYFNYTGNFYRISSPYSNVNAYSCGFKPLVSDQSVYNASIMTGVYSNGTLLGLGVSGLIGIDYNNSIAYFTGSAPASLSGIFSVVEFPIKTTNVPEENLLFETKFEKRPKTTINTITTGLLSNTYTYPVIYLRNDGGNKKEFALGGSQENIINVKGVVLADSEFALTAITSLCKDTYQKYFKLFDISDNPFNSYGSYKNNVIYNYTGVAATKSDFGYISRADAYNFSRNNIALGEIRKMNPEIFPGVIEFEIRSVE